MSDNAEEGIARAQAQAAQTQGTDGFQKHHEKNVVYINERILVFILSIAFIGLIIVWLTAESTLITYGSLAGVILLVVFWGFVQIKKINRVKVEREHQAKSWQSNRSKNAR